MLTSSLTLFRNGINGYSAIATGALGVKAWYKASSVTAAVDAASTGALSTTTSVPENGNLTFLFTVTPSGTVKLSDDTDGKSYFYTTGNVKTEATAVAYTAEYGTATIALSKIYLTSDDTKTALNAAALKAYADTYNFEAAVSGQARIGTTEPTSYATVASALTTADVAVNVTINADGTTTLSRSSVYFRVAGSDSVYDGSEAGSISIKVAD